MSVAEEELYVESAIANGYLGLPVMEFRKCTELGDWWTSNLQAMEEMLLAAGCTSAEGRRVA